jgi:hypothetical protein
MCTVLLPPGGNPIAVNKYIIYPINNQKFEENIHSYSCCDNRGHAVAPLVEALRYKPEGRGFDFRWCNWNFSLN